MPARFLAPRHNRRYFMPQPRGELGPIDDSRVGSVRGYRANSECLGYPSTLGHHLDHQSNRVIQSAGWRSWVARCPCAARLPVLWEAANITIVIMQRVDQL